MYVESKKVFLFKDNDERFYPIFKRRIFIKWRDFRGLRDFILFLREEYQVERFYRLDC